MPGSSKSTLQLLLGGIQVNVWQLQRLPLQPWQRPPPPRLLVHVLRHLRELLHAALRAAPYHTCQHQPKGM